MKFKLLLSTIMTAIVCSHPALAKSPILNDDPAQECPSVEAIRAVGLTRAEGDANEWGAIYEPGSKYDTPYFWHFMIGSKHNKTAKSDNEAMQKAIQAMQSLRFKHAVGGQTFIICEYSANGNVAGIAHTAKNSLVIR